MTTASPKQNKSTGLWGFVVDVGEDPATGRRRQVRRRGFKTKKEALAALDTVRPAAREHTFVPSSRQTVEQYLTEWLAKAEPTIRPATYHSYSRNVRVHVTPKVGALKLQAVDGMVLDGLYAELSKRLAPRTVRYIHAVIGRAFKDAVKVGRLVRNPAEAATPPKPNSATSAKPMGT